MAKQGISISFRLHPSDPKEKQAIELIQQYTEQGLEPRKFITDALLRAAGFTPEMFRESDEKLTASLLTSILTDFGNHLIENIRANGGVIPATQSTQDVEFDEDEDPDMVKNIAAGWAARNKR